MARMVLAWPAMVRCIMVIVEFIAVSRASIAAIVASWACKHVAGVSIVNFRGGLALPGSGSTQDRLYLSYRMVCVMLVVVGGRSNHLDETAVLSVVRVQRGKVDAIGHDALCEVDMCVHEKLKQDETTQQSIVPPHLIVPP